MRAMQVTALGARLEMREAPRPEPGPGEALVRVLACGLNFADTLLAAGRYQEKPPLPFTPGLEICGVVEALGPDAPGSRLVPGSVPGNGSAPGLSPGDRVAAFVGGGGLAEFVAVPAARCVRAPAAMPDAEVAGFLVAYGTSDVALRVRARLAPGERLLVTGASGGVGLTAVELGKLLGAEVVAVARGPERLAAAEAAGADRLIDGETADLAAAVKALGGADVVYETVGGAVFDAALRAARPEARILPIGFAGGVVPQIPANILLVKNLTAIGVHWGAYAGLRPQVLTESFAQLFAWYGAGRLRPHVGRTLPLEAANEGLDLLRDRAATGKVVIRVA